MRNNLSLKPYSHENKLFAGRNPGIRRHNDSDFPAEHPGLEINLESTVAYQFGEQIKNVIKETVGELGVTDARIEAIDKGALDCTIRARTTAAVVRATGVDVWQD